MSMKNYLSGKLICGLLMVSLTIVGCHQKHYCCQLPNGCIDGPADGQDKCRELNGIPVEGATCENGKCASQDGCEQKRYCCQLSNGCIDGPADGQGKCRELKGTPVEGAICQSGECVPQQ